MAASPKERSSTATAPASKWLNKNNGPLLAGHEQLNEPSAIARTGEGNGMGSVHGVKLGPSQTSRQISRPIQSGNTTDITSVRVDNSPLAP